MKEKQIIGVDLDDVLADYCNPLIEFHNQTFGTNLSRQEFKSYRLWEVWGGTQEEATRKVYLFHSTDYFKNIAPVRGSLEGVDVLTKHYNLVIITSRFTDFMEHTRQWLNNFFPNKFSEVYFTNHWNLITGGTYKKKSDLCLEIGAKVIIEDSIEYALDCTKVGIKTILLDNPWNQYKKVRGINRVKSWKQVHQKLYWYSY